MDKVEFWTREVGEGEMTLLGTVTENAAAEFERQIRAAELVGHGRDLPDKPDGNSKYVCIMAVDEEIYSQAMERHGALPIDIRMDFPDALALSRHMGYGSNQVALALFKARAKRQNEAVLRGVTVQYLEDVRE